MNKRYLPIAGLLAVTTIAAISPVGRSTIAMLVASATDRDTLHAVQVRIHTDSLRTYGGVLARRLGTRIDSLEGELLAPDSTPAPPPPPPSDTVHLPLDTVPLPPAPTTCTKTVGNGASLQNALNSATGGDVICLQSGTWASIVLPKRADTNWVVVRPQSTDASFATPGTRLRPTLATNLPKIQGVGAPVVSVAAGAVGWRLIGLNITVTPSTNTTYSIVEFGAFSTSTLGNLPRKIVLERSFVHGTLTSPVRRCVALNGTSLAVIDSWIEECHESGIQSQAIYGCTGTGKYRISNNTLIAMSEVIAFGGCDPGIANLVAADVTIRRNHLYLPATWKGQWTPVASRFETKYVVRLEFSQNVVDGAWADAHQGESFTLKSVNQGGACPKCRTSDVTIQDNLFKNVGRGFYFVGRDRPPTGATVDSVLRRVKVTKNFVDSLNVSPFTGGQPVFQVAFIEAAEGIEISYNTFNYGKVIDDYLAFFPGSISVTTAVNGASIGNNIFLHGSYGVIGCGATPWTTCAQSVSFGANAIVGSGPMTVVPSGVVYPTVANALTAGYGVSRTYIDAKVNGVIVAR